MFRRILSRARLLEAGERARREHEVWLNHALRSGRRLPRIPRRKVSEGGFSAVTRTESGRRWAEAWWQGTLDTLD